MMHSIWFVLVLSVLSSSVSAATLGDLTYEIADDQVAITGCKKSTLGVLIPAEIEGLPVTSIGKETFKWCGSLTSITIPEAFHSHSEANRLRLGHLWPDSFFLPSSPPRKTPELSIRLAPVITITGELDEAVTIEVADTVDGPWTEWRTVVIGEDGTTAVDLDEGAEQRFYRVRD